VGEGLDPTLGAILPLIGVLLGVLGSGAAGYFLKRRDERLAFRAIARVLVENLRSTATYIEHLLHAQALSAAIDDAGASMRRAVWEDHELAVAQHIADYEVWRRISTGCENALIAGLLIGGSMGKPHQEDTARRLIEEMRTAAEDLWPYAHPPRRGDASA
jgi:hypothetical protein